MFCITKRLAVCVLCRQYLTSFDTAKKILSLVITGYEYYELECEFRPMTLAVMLRAGKLFKLTPDYFLASEKRSTQLRASAAGEALKILETANLESVYE